MKTPRRIASFFVHAALALALAIPAALAGRDYRLVLSAAEVDRAALVVAFPLPADAPASPVLRDAAGQHLPVQTDGDRSARFLLGALRAQETATFTLQAADPAALFPSGVTTVQEKEVVRLDVSGRTVLEYRLEAVAPRGDIKPEILRAGYIHPVFSPAGQRVTEDYPADHVHHHGIWAPWTRTRFQGRSPDFWNMQNRTGAEHLVALDRTWSGPVHGGLAARLQMVDLSAPTPVAALDAAWEVTVYAMSGSARPVHVFDLRITQTCATADALELPEYHYGGFGFRGSALWAGPGEAARFLTSEGISDRLKGNGTRARWCYLGGAVPGGVAGTAVLGHPQNHRSPQPVRLHPHMPYFSFAPQQLGAFSIEPGQPYIARFRFIVADGEPDPAFLEACHQGYARPAEVRLTPL